MGNVIVAGVMDITNVACGCCDYKETRVAQGEHVAIYDAPQKARDTNTNQSREENSILENLSQSINISVASEECRILLVGALEVGKTTLWHNLRKLPVPSDYHHSEQTMTSTLVFKPDRNKGESRRNSSNPHQRPVKLKFLDVACDDFEGQMQSAANDLVIFMVSLADSNSINFVEEVLQNQGKRYRSAFLVGNKSDMVTEQCQAQFDQLAVLADTKSAQNSGQLIASEVGSLFFAEYVCMAAYTGGAKLSTSREQNSKGSLNGSSRGSANVSGSGWDKMARTRKRRPTAVKDPHGKLGEQAELALAQIRMWVQKQLFA